MTGQNPAPAKVAVIVGATSKWRTDARHAASIAAGKISDTDVPVEARWGVGGAIAQKFASEGYIIALTTRHRDNAGALAEASSEQGGRAMIFELDLTQRSSVTAAFADIRSHAGDPEIVIYNAGYTSGRELPPGKELERRAFRHIRLL